MERRVDRVTNGKTAGLVVAGIFAGVGGFELGFEKVGAKTALLCEIDHDAQTVLSTRFPDVPVVSDVRSLEVLPAEVNVVTAGFPCQDLSMAGSKSGIDGKLSSVVRHLFRLLSRSKVEWVVVENVYFMLQLDHGRAIRVLAESLEDLGYRWVYRVIDSISFLPQRRRRVFMVASLSHDPRPVLFADGELAQKTNGPHEFPLNFPLGFYWTEGRSGVGLTLNAIPPLKAGSGIGIPSPPAILRPDGVLGTPSLADCERLQGFPAGWTLPAYPEGKRHDRRWRLVGNAVSVPVASWLARRLAQQKERGEIDVALAPIKRGKAWPAAAFNVDGVRYGCNLNSRVTNRKTRGLSEILKDDLRPLSSRAIKGFLSRAREGGLKFPRGFLDRLEACASE